MIIYKNIVFHRGDKDAVRLDYPGDIAQHNLAFVLKKDRELTSSRLLEINKLNPLDSEKFTALFDESKNITHITIQPDIEDTQDLSGSFVFDIYDYTDSVTRIDGNFYVEPDVQTPYDGTNLPSDGKRYIPYYPENFNNKEILQYNSTQKTFSGIAPGNLSDNNFYNKSEVDTTFSTKVDKISGKGLSTNDFTDGLKTGYDSHLINTSNPHLTTKFQIGLGNVPNLDSTNSINNLGGMNILNQTLIEWTENLTFQLLAITRDSNGVISSATVQWPDSSSGNFIATTINNTWLSIDAYSVTHVLSGKTVTQSLVKRDNNGNIITKPILTVT